MVECVLHRTLNVHNKGMRCLMSACNKSRSALLFIQLPAPSSFYSACPQLHCSVPRSISPKLYSDVAEITNCVYGTLDKISTSVQGGGTTCTYSCMQL